MPVPNVTLNDGNKMPQLGLGVWQASEGGEVERAVTAALKTGYRLIDTAAVYRNEAGVGSAIASSGVARDELFVTTKLWNSDQDADKVRSALMTSLEKLGLDYIDLYLIHWPMPAHGLFPAAWAELEKLKAEGLIRSIGVCNFLPEHLDELARHSDVVPAINQIELHPWFNQAASRDDATSRGIQIESWSPIGQGGDLLRDATITAIAEAHGKTSAQVIIRWHLQHDLVVIPKSTHPERIAENFDVFGFELSDQQMAQIDSLNQDKRLGANPLTMNMK
ncbi:MAG TPA: aldo/keto reductase [Candidatus Saccharimonadales bacterium]|jgi:diketogulonate reductase-like aldo/keto reductase